MPHSVPVSHLMIHRNEWPQLRADTDVISAVKILRIVAEDRKLHEGHSIALVLDDSYNLLGLVRLTDLVKNIRHLCDESDPNCDMSSAHKHIKELVLPFAGFVGPDDNILKALDIMLEHGVSLVPVMKDGKLQGLVKLADIFNTVAAILFDEKDPEKNDLLIKRFHL
jgi:CBS domain-containing protein